MSEQANGVAKTFLSDEALVEAWRDKVYETTRSSRFDQDDYLLLVSMAEDNFKASLGIPNPAEFVRAARELAEAVETQAARLDPDMHPVDIRLTRDGLLVALSAFRAAGGGQ